MIEINLIPDVKQEFLKAQQVRNTVMSVSLIVMISAGIAAAVLGSIYGGLIATGAIQDGLISSKYSTLEKTEGLNDAVTVQNQLSKVNSYHDSQYLTSRMIDIIKALNSESGNNIKINTFNLDPVSNLVNIEGSSTGGYPATEEFKKLIQDIKIQYQNSDGTSTSDPLATNVTMGETNYSEDSDGTKVLNFTLSFTYNENTLTRSAKGFRLETPASQKNVTDSAQRVSDVLLNGGSSEGDN